MPDIPRPRLGELERAVMDVLWDTEDGATRTVREVFTVLSADRDIAYTTVMTVLDRLAKKNLVRQHRDGRAYRYSPTEPRAAMVAGVMMQALADTSQDVRQAALVHFAGQVTPQEAEQLQAALAQVIAADAAGTAAGVRRRRSRAPR